MYGCDVIISLVAAYASHVGLRETTVAKRCAGQAHAIDRLRSGHHSITVRRAERIVQWLSDHWPADLPWPDGIDRPAPTPGSPAAAAPSPSSLPSCGGGGDPAAACAELRRRELDAWHAQRPAEALRLRAEAEALATRLDPETGLIARPDAVLAATGLGRRDWDYVVGRYADGRGGRPRADAPKRLVALLVASGDRRFRARSAAA